MATNNEAILLEAILKIKNCTEKDAVYTIAKIREIAGNAIRATQNK